MVENNHLRIDTQRGLIMELLKDKLSPAAPAVFSLADVQPPAPPLTAFIRALKARNVLMDEYAHGQVRAVTHNDIATSDLGPIVAAVRGALEETSGARAGSGDVREEELQGV